MVRVKVIETDLPGCLVIEPRVFGDERGFFFESFNARSAAPSSASTCAFVQGNVSSLRSAACCAACITSGRKPQGKLVSVLEGEVYDVAVDIRRGSPTFGQLDRRRAERRQQAPLLDPAGFRPRLRGAERARAVHLPVHRNLRREADAALALGRSRTRDRLAAVGAVCSRRRTPRRRSSRTSPRRACPISHDRTGHRRDRPGRLRTGHRASPRARIPWSRPAAGEAPLVRAALRGAGRHEPRGDRCPGPRAAAARGGQRGRAHGGGPRRRRA